MTVSVCPRARMNVTSRNAACPEPPRVCRPQLVEVADQHDIGVVFVELRIEHVLAVRRDGDAVGKFAIGFEDFPSVPGCEIVEANGPWRRLRNKINSTR